jgi:predicted ribosome quality control (RQC) complex YloA/Tae2 family protein
MAMTWDAPLTAALALELDALLRNDRLKGHRFHWDERELWLFFRSCTLRWSLHPSRGWIASLPPEALPPDARPRSARVVGVAAPPDERLLRIHLRKLRGGGQPLQVIVELMTNQWNALLVEGEDERIRHLLWTRRSAGRTLSVGHAYVPPEPSSREGITGFPCVGEWKRITDPSTGDDRRSRVLATLAFTSPVNIGAVLGDGLEDEPLGYQLWNQLRTLDPMEPCVLQLPGGRQPYPVILHGFSYVKLPSVLEALADAAESGEGGGDASGKVLATLDKALQRAERRAASLRREMTREGGDQGPREKANLLLAHLREVEKGATSVTLTGFHGEAVEISLDPSLSPQENAQSLYREAAKVDRARERLPGLLEEAEERIRELRSLRSDLLQGSVSPEEAESRLPTSLRSGKGPGEPEEERLPYRRFRSSGGLEIRVGRGGADNDALTFRRSRPDDIWLHARDAAGAHVILRWTGDGPPPAKDLGEAAGLAALHSRARHAGLVPVDWTRRKYVRKPRKAPPGRVLPERVQTLFVEPDSDLPRKLGDSE